MLNVMIYSNQSNHSENNPQLISMQDKKLHEIYQDSSNQIWFQE